MKGDLIYFKEGLLMADISTQFDNNRYNGIMERRGGERRSRQRRRVLDSAENHDGVERRAVNTDRRTTLFNRLNREVTDRRSLN